MMLFEENDYSDYGDIDFIPAEQYSRGDAERAIQDAQFVVQIIS